MRHALLALALSARLGAQTVTARTSTELRAEPGAGALGTLRAGASVRAGAERAGYTEVSLVGFVRAAAVRDTSGQYGLTISASAGTPVRTAASADAPAIANLRLRTALELVTRQGAWIEVRRNAWASSEVLRPSIPSVALSAPAAGSRDSTPTTASPAAAAFAGALLASQGGAIRETPDGRALATLAPGATLAPLLRDRGWVRVRIEGWMLDRGLVPADTAVGPTLSAADLRSDAERVRGRVVRWEVEVLALQSADPLRRDLALDEPYLLARGPGAENALLYLAVPPSLLANARELPKPALVTVTARVRNGRSEPVGVPILDLQSISRR